MLILLRSMDIACPAHNVAFGAAADRTNLHRGRNGELIASLLGHERDEIALYRA